ncbi:hypothetical protein HDC95_002193 [Microbacterium sp. AK031]|nr:hypothetical protein [Microbacterium sp. AK031]
MTIRRSTRAGLAAVGILALLSVGTASTTPTEAAWTKPQYGAGGTISAVDLRTAPTITSCTLTTVAIVPVGVILDTVTIKWKSTAPPMMQRVYFGTVLGTVTPTLEATSPGEYSYTVTYSKGLLESLLTNLLGSTTVITVKAEGGTWASPAATKSLRVGLLGLNPTCT